MFFFFFFLSQLSRFDDSVGPAAWVADSDGQFLAYLKRYIPADIQSSLAYFVPKFTFPSNYARSSRSIFRPSMCMIHPVTLWLASSVLLNFFPLCVVSGL